MQLDDIARANSLVALFLARADELGDRPFLAAKVGGAWTSISWREAARQVCAMAASLRAMGLADGDRVLIVAENRPEWCIADLAIMAAGCITTPAYTTNTEGDHRHILDDSGARAVFVSNERLAGPLLRAMIRSGRAEHLIAIEPITATQSGSFALHRWGEQIESVDEAEARRQVDERLATATREDLACIIYTSGTSGPPRGVMLHHGAVLANVAAAAEALVQDFGWGEERFLSVLPLSHAFEHTAGFMLPICLGAEIWFAEGLDKLATNLTEARPTIMVVVPRLFEVLRARIIKQVEKEGGIAKWLLEQAERLGDRQLEGPLRLRDRPVDLLLARTIRPKIAQRFGGRVKALVSGGAPLNAEVGAFFQGLGLTMLQGYGQTEAAPVISCNIPSAGIRLRTVGPPLGEATQVRIAEDGEILVRGPLVMKGYWQNPQETARALRDGWLHTGDIGHLDKGGRIVITDRKKDLIINDKGDNIAPQKLEGMLTLQPEISQAMVSGDKRPHIVALIVPDAEWALGWAREHGLTEDLPALAALPEFTSAIKAAIERTNAELSVAEKVRKFILADEPFTVETGELTPTLKIRRHQLRARYGARLEALY